MASHSSIYTWKRQKNKPVFSSRGNVREWVKQVQRACDDAAKDIFGDNVNQVLGTRDLYVDDDVILEGQDLIDSWIQKKNVDELLAECEIQDEAPNISLTRYDKLSEQFRHHKNRESSNLFDSSPNYYEDDQAEVWKPVFDLDDDFDEECAVHEVVYNMLEKDVVDLNYINDEIKFKNRTKKFKDPTPKMKLRHEQVKKRASERKIAWEEAHLKKINKKSVEEEARKQLQREEKQRLDNFKREEDEIRKEMVKIRRVMQEENAQRTKQHSRKLESEEKAKNLAKKEVRKKREEIEERSMKQEYEAKEATKKKILKQEEEEEKRKQGDLKLLQSCFSSWYALVVNKHIKCSKARALMEWRRKLRIWNAWRTYVLRARSDRETRAINEQMKERHRKEILADRFYRQMLFHRCVTAWLSWVEKKKEERILKEQHDTRAKKMATLLKAASSGQLWQERKIEEESGHNSPEELEEISLKPFKLQGVTEEPSQKTARNSFVPSKVKSKNECLTRQAWPHQRLKEMKARKPVKKQNALLDNIGSITTRTESSITTTHAKDCPRIENKTIHEKGRSQEEVQRTSPPYCKDINLRSQNPKSNAVQNNGNDRIEQIVDHTDRNIAEVENATSFPKNNTRKKQYGGIEGNEPQQSTRSTSATSVKSKVISRKPPTKPLHLAMEERAKARAERKSLLDAKKKAAEEEKLTMLKQEQEEKEREILAEKQAALQKKREETKLAKQREQEKQQRLDEIREMNKKADERYHNTLLRKFGFLPWKKLIQTRDEMVNNAEFFYKKKLKSTCFREWLAYTRSECKRRNQLAVNMYMSSLLRFGWQSWRKYRNHLAEMEKIALEFSRRYVAKKYIKIWQDFVIEERLLYWDKENNADEHNDKRLLRKAMTYWKKYIPLLKEEEKREKRRNDLRKHVMSLLPDFQTSHVNHSP